MSVGRARAGAVVWLAKWPSVAVRCNDNCREWLGVELTAVPAVGQEAEKVERLGEVPRLVWAFGCEMDVGVVGVVVVALIETEGSPSVTCCDVWFAAMV